MANLLTPPDLMATLQRRYKFDFDPCPHPRQPGFDGLATEWGKCSYVNPVFGGYTDEQTGRKTGPTAWARKCREQAAAGKRVILVYPIDKWLLAILTDPTLKATRNLGDVKWLSTETGEANRGTGRHIALFDLDGRPRSLAQRQRKKT